MYHTDQFKIISNKYGSFASWALWDVIEERRTDVIDDNVDKLHSKYVLLGLNVSGPLKNKRWINFHGGKHDRKIKYACTDNILTGSYLTDIFKNIEISKSNNVKELLTKDVVNANVSLFIQEMQDIKIKPSTCFIIFGKEKSLMADCFNKYFSKHFDNKVIYYYHYSYYRFTDQKWVTGLWKELGISQDYNTTIKKYKN